MDYLKKNILIYFFVVIVKFEIIIVFCILIYLFVKFVIFSDVGVLKIIVMLFLFFYKYVFEWGLFLWI